MSLNYYQRRCPSNPKKKPKTGPLDNQKFFAQIGLTATHITLTPTVTPAIDLPKVRKSDGQLP